MTSRAIINEFLARPVIALAGASRSGKKFGNAAMRELRARGYRIHPVHPMGGTIDGVPAVTSLAGLPEPVEALLVVVPPIAALDVIRDAAGAGIRFVWLQQGAESEPVLRLCADLGLVTIAGECILLHAQPAGFHKLHRWIRGAFGRLPA